jgi:vacuolar-type H+-ATPase subunit D/Vma8
MSSIITIDLLSDSLLNAAVAVGVAVLANVVSSFAHDRLRKKQPSYSERVGRLAESLTSSSREVDSILKEIASVTKERQEAAEELENELERLAENEAELQQRINTLKSVPIPVAEHFAKLMESGEKRSAKRDYLLFGAGVLTSIVSAIVLKWLGLA